jgi:hypothetical protein
MNNTGTNEDHYWNLLKSTQKPVYAEFIEKLENTPELQRGVGRAALFETEIATGTGTRTQDQHRIFINSEELRTFFETSPIKANTQRVLVLEDLPRNFVEVLGSQLHIPTSFFGDHWANPDDPFTRRTLRHQDPARRYMLIWRKIHRSTITPEEDDPDTFLKIGGVSRTVSKVSISEKKGQRIMTGEKLSFWSVELENNSRTGQFLSTYRAALLKCD